jgi:transcriptional regulator with XRE-family HTH domain
MTPNQVVAHNLRRARLRRGWTQSETAARIGLGWSKATYSAAERSVTSRRIRHFDADEIVMARR